MKASIKARLGAAYALGGVMVAVFLLSCGRVAHAACEPKTFHQPVGELSHVHGVDTLRPGAPLSNGWTWPVGLVTLFDLINCSAFGARVEVYPTKTPIPGVTYSDGAETVPVYPTGVDGIGYVAQMMGPGAPSWSYLRPPRTETVSHEQVWGNLGMIVRLLFVVTGPLKSGTYTIPSQTMATANAFTLGSTTPLTAPATIMLDGGGALTVNAGSCSMTTPPHQSIALPTVTRSDFPVVNSNAGQAVSFRIGINCDANVALHLTMTDASNPSNTSNILALAKDSTAAGVGVQLFRGDAADTVAYGPDSSAPGNTNQWLIGSSSTETSYSIPFTAAYVRTGAIAPGSVVAKATFTFSYQ